jgi:Domain of unknown function (DUF4403)
MSRRKIFIGGLIGAVVLSGALWALDKFGAFGPSYLQRPELAASPPLKPTTLISVMTVPVAVELAAIRASVDAAMPRTFTGRHDNFPSGPFSKTDVRWNIDRDDLAVTGRPAELTMLAALSGTLRVGAGGGDVITGSLSGNGLGSQQQLVWAPVIHTGEMRGSITLTARPTLLPTWRVDPKLSGRVRIPEGGLTISGFTIDVSGDVKSTIDHAVNQQVDVVQDKVRNDDTIERVARGQWTKMCRSISLASISAGNADLWLELRPVRAFAAHPQINTSAATVTLGVEAETRILAAESKPNCPFPIQLEIVSPVDEGRFAIATPIELPFTEINRILDLQLKGKVFPANADAAAQFKVLQASIAPSGNQLLISLLIDATERKTWFGFDAKATVYIWVQPELDREQQKLRLTNMVLDVKSNGVFGLFGVAARIAIPYLQEELQQYAVIDLKPYAASARTGIEAIVADFDKQDDGVNARATVTDLRLAVVEFDSKTLRVIAEADGTAKIAVTKLVKQ